MRARSRKEEKAIAIKRATLQTLAAIAAHGGAFYDAIGLEWETVDGKSGGNLKTHVREWVAPIRDAACATYAEACERQAFIIEADGMGRGFRLARLGAPNGKGKRAGGHLYSGELFRDADTLWSVMRTAEDLATHPACKATDPEVTRPRSIVVIGRRHTDRAGNTYHTAEIIVDGATLVKTDRAYGYGDHYLQVTAADWLQSKGIVTRERYSNGAHEPLWQACKRDGITLNYQAFDVAKGAL